MKLSFSSAARADLRELRRYISKELYNPSSAERIISEIIKSCKRLKDFPMLGVSVNEKYGIDIDARYRLLISGNYIIVYKKEDVQIIIVRIINGRTDYMHILMNELQ